MVWGLWPLLTSRASSAYRRFVLMDMYTLVLQIAVAGAILSQTHRDDDRLLSFLIFSALVLAVIWRFMVAALDDHGIRENRERIVVLTVAPVQIMFGPVVFWMGLYKLVTTDGLGFTEVATGLLIPCLSHRIYLWALQARKPAEVPPVVSGS